MAVIDAQGRVIVETWSYPDVGNSVAPNIIVRLGTLLAVAEANLPKPLGVLLPSDTVIGTIASYLDHLDVVAIEFPKFRDGRGFAIARSLCEHHHYCGDIRAVGHVLPDQFTALIRCGFSSVLTPPDHPPAQWPGVTTLPATAAQQSGPLLRRLLSCQSTENHES